MNRLKELRKERKLSLRELGELTTISYSSISDMENGNRPFTQGNLEILCNFFNVSSDYLLGLSDQRNSSSTTYHEHLEGIDIELLNDIKNLSDKDKEDLKTIIKYLKVKGELWKMVVPKQDAPLEQDIEFEFLALKNDVVVLLLGSKIKVMINHLKGFKPNEIQYLNNLIIEKRKALDLKSSAAGLIVVDIIDDLRLLISSSN